MRFCQLEKISELIPGKSISASRYLTGDEDYLIDHFPRFAVMPGVLMLECLFQASALLVRETEGHESGLVFLRAAKNVKFGDFVQPKQTLNVNAEIVKSENSRYTIKAAGTKRNPESGLDSIAVSGRLILDCADGGQPEIVNQHACLYMRQLTDQLKLAAID